MEIIERRANGSYVIIKNGQPYHVIPNEPEWVPVCQQEGVDPDEQAAIYAASLIPPAPPAELEAEQTPEQEL